MASTPGFEPGPHWWEASALTTAPSLAPQRVLQISLKLHENRGCYWRKKLPWMIFEEQFPVPRYTAASKIGNSVTSLLWQLRCRCNPDHNKFSSSSNTTAVAIFPKLCFWRRSLSSNLGGIDPETLYRATLSIFFRILTHGYGFHNTRCPAVGNSCWIWTKHLIEFV